MMYTRNAYMPIATYPEVVADGAVLAATSYAAVLGGTLHVTTFAVDIPYMSSGLGDFFVDVPGLARAVEQKSKAECHRLLPWFKSMRERGLMFTVRLEQLCSAVCWTQLPDKHDISTLRCFLGQGKQWLLKIWPRLSCSVQVDRPSWFRRPPALLPLNISR